MKKDKKFGLDLTQGSIPVLLLRFAWPFLAAGLVSALYGAVDLFVVGHFSGQEVIAGVSTGSQVMNIVFACTIGICTGGTVLVGRKIGERDDEGCARAVGTFLFVGVLLAVFVTAIIAIFRQPLLTALQTPDEARPAALSYLAFTIIGIPFSIGYNVICAIARGLGNSSTPSIVGAIGAGANIVLDFIFAGALGWGAMGVALATSVSQFVTFSVIGIWLIRRRFPFAFKKRDFGFHKESFASIFKVGVPLWLQDLLVTLSFMIITGIVNAMGVVAGASVGLISKVFSLGGMIPQSFGSALAAVSAQNLGAGKRDRALRALKYGIGYSLAIEIVLCALCQIIPEQICGIFANGKPEVVLGAANYLRTFSIDLMLVSFVFCMNSFLSGCGMSSVSMVHSMIATFGVRIPLSFLFTSLTDDVNRGLFLLGLASPIASVPSIVICVVFIYMYNRKQKRLATVVT
ncbi:MAG: MATE family efflux transporter [Oscillospiraceae bacterium]|jgi:putative MATE family efflux protein|nr:MATE family efflux transporter [Oscillospiraceae bacterium]